MLRAVEIEIIEDVPKMIDLEIAPPLGPSDSEASADEGGGRSSNVAVDTELFMQSAGATAGPGRRAPRPGGAAAARARRAGLDLPGCQQPACL